MNRIHFTVVWAAVIWATAILTAITWPGDSWAQSNPLLPEGVGSGRDLSAYYYPSGAGGGSGRARARGDVNPAETLLREMNGTNYRRHSGRAYFRGRPVDEARRIIARQMARDRRRAQLEQTILAPQPTRRRGASDRSARANRARQPRAAAAATERAGLLSVAAVWNPPCLEARRVSEGSIATSLAYASRYQPLS